MKRTFQIVLAVAWMLIPLLTQAQGNLIDAPLPHSKGQSVSPSFEGWYANPNGSFSLVFGYFNRNYEQDLSLSIGPNNQFEPGPADRGQPTYFHPRRHTGVFAVEVPADFGNQQLNWRLTAGGESIAIPGHLRPEWEITALEEITSGNTPPVVKFSNNGNSAQGPLGVASPLITTRTGTTAELTIWSSDDGVKKSRAAGQAARTGLVLSKYRGPGDIEIEDATPRLVDGMASTTATFSEPGDYTLRVLAWDDSGGQGPIMAGGFFCCWTNAFIEVKVE
ncbi:MAG: hypothetical protein GKR91_14935 [Pseudomonadales bacterium]|nr:hypothetical protein [Pseudomonadales bacterium]